MSESNFLYKNIVLLRRAISQKLGHRSDQINKKKLIGILPSDPVIVEAGASNGGDTVELAALFPNGKIFAFEPLAESYKKLQRKSEKFSNITPINLALGKKKEVQVLNIGSNPGSSSLSAPKEHLLYWPKVTFSKQQKVQVVNLEKWANENNVSKVDFLWLDLQGYEWITIKNSVNLITKATALYVEVSEKKLYSHSVAYSEFRDKMNEIGFEVEEEFLTQKMGNVLFVKKSTLNN